jgi:membrane protein DedA with SNARE-associated domain
MDEKLQEDWLDARLRDEVPYIDDAGFTSQVVHKLPARQVRRSYRVFILLSITIAACLAAFWFAGGTSLAFEAYANVAMLPVMWMWIFAAAVAVLVMAGGLAAALSRSRGRSR